MVYIDWASQHLTVDRTKAFREFFERLNTITFPDTSRKPLRTEVVQVADQVTTLDPVMEAAAVQRMINQHNEQLPPRAQPLEIRRTVFFTGYLINSADTVKLLDLVKIPSNFVEPEIRFHGNSILIAPRPADHQILSKVGGIGSKQSWQVNGFAFFQSSIWAVRVTPVPANSSVQTAHSPALIVLATYKNAKPALANNIRTWQSVPADKQYILQTQVGEKVQLRIETVIDQSGEGNNHERRGLKRRLSPNQGPGMDGTSEDENRRTMYGQNGTRFTNHNRNNMAAPGYNTGRTNNGQAHGRGGRRANRGGPRGAYKSLDDVAASKAGPQRGDPIYDDSAMAGPSEHAAPAGKENAGGLPYGY